MHFRTQLAITFLSLSIITPQAVAGPIPLDLGSIFDKVKETFNDLVNNYGLDDIANKIEQDATDIMKGLMPGSPGKRVYLLAFLFLFFSPLF